MREISHGWDAHPGIFCCTWQVLKHSEYKSQSTNSCVEELSHLFSLEAKSISIFNLYLDWQVKQLPSLLIGIPTYLSHSWVRPRGQHIGVGGVFRSWAISLCVTWAPVCTTPSDQQCSAVSGPPEAQESQDRPACTTGCRSALEAASGRQLCFVWPTLGFKNILANF